jgi:hypothetical protein
MSQQRPSVGNALRAPELAAAVVQVAGVLDSHAEALDALPVAGHPDAGAPGTDAAAALAGAAEAGGSRRDFAGLGVALADGAGSAATGPVGRWVATWLSGVAEVLRSTDRLDGERCALALEAGAEAAVAGGAPAGPGTFGSVSAAAATGALAVADDGGPLPAVLIAAADAGLEELERGPDSDASLGGAVDAASAALLLVLDSLASVVTGEPLPQPPPSGGADDGGPVAYVDRYDVHGAVVPEEDCGPGEAFHLRSVLRELADDSSLDDSDPQRWPFRATTPRPGAVIEAVCEVGRPRDLSIRVRRVEEERP